MMLFNAADTELDREALRRRPFAYVCELTGYRYTKVLLATPAKHVIRRDGDISHIAEGL